MNTEHNDEYIINLINNIDYTNNLITFIVNNVTIPIYKALISKINGEYYNYLDYDRLHRNISIDNILNDYVVKNIIITNFDQTDSKIDRFISTSNEYNIIFPAFKYRSGLNSNEYIIKGGSAILHKSSIIIDIKENGNFLLTKNRYS